MSPELCARLAGAVAGSGAGLTGTAQGAGGEGARRGGRSLLHPAPGSGRRVLRDPVAVT